MSLPCCLKTSLSNLRPTTPGLSTFRHSRRIRYAKLRRSYVSAHADSSSVPSFHVFDRNVKRIQRDRAAKNVEDARTVDYLRSEIADRLSERLLLINRKFDNVLDLGAGACHIARSILLREPLEDDSSPESVSTSTARGGGTGAQVSRLVCAELSPEMLYRDHPLPEPKHAGNGKPEIELIPADEELLLLRPPEYGGQFSDNTFDAVLSGGSLHWINDLPSVLRNINRVLKPDGPLLAAMIGGDSLYELRSSLQLADLERLGGVTPHISPLADVRDIGGLLQGASFKLLTIDVEEIVVEYPDVFALMKDLGSMGEGNAVLVRRMSGLGKEVLYALDGIYREMYGAWGGSIPATFRIIHFIGWKASECQRKPLERGSAKLSLKDALKTST